MITVGSSAGNRQLAGGYRLVDLDVLVLAAPAPLHMHGWPLALIGVVCSQVSVQILTHGG